MPELIGNVRVFQGADAYVGYRGTGMGRDIQSCIERFFWKSEQLEHAPEGVGNTS